MSSFIAPRFESFFQRLKHVFLSLTMVFALASAGLFSADAEASKRLGSGGSTGKQSSIATQKQATPPQAAPSQAAAPAAAGAQAAAQSQRSKWLGPIAGLAAGLGLAALASHFGFGEELANFMMIALLVMAVLFIIRMVMARRQSANQASSASGQPAWAAAGAGSNASSPQGYSQTQQGQQQNGLFSQQAASQQPAQSGGLFGSMNQPTAASLLRRVLNPGAFRPILMFLALLKTRNIISVVCRLPMTLAILMICANSPRLSCLPSLLRRFVLVRAKTIPRWFDSTPSCSVLRLRMASIWQACALAA